MASKETGPAAHMALNPTAHKEPRELIGSPDVDGSTMRLQTGGGPGQTEPGPLNPVLF